MNRLPTVSRRKLLQRGTALTAAATLTMAQAEGEVISESNAQPTPAFPGQLEQQATAGFDLRQRQTYEIRR